MAEDAGVIAVDHMGFSVASLEEAIQFWTEAMGFDLARRGEMGGEFLREATGVDDPRCRMALVTAPNGYPIELLEYSTGRTLGQTPRSAGAIGAAHIAITVADIRTAIARVGDGGVGSEGFAAANTSRPPKRNDGRVHLRSGWYHHRADAAARSTFPRRVTPPRSGKAPLCRFSVPLLANPQLFEAMLRVYPKIEFDFRADAVSLCTPRHHDQTKTP